VDRLSPFNHDLHAAALRERGIDLILTSRSRAEWSIDRCQLENCAIEFRNEGGSAIVAGISGQDLITFAVLTSASSDRNLFNGQEVQGLDLIVIPPAQKFIQTAAGPHAWISATVPVAILPQLEPSVREAFDRLLGIRRVLVLRSRTLAKQIAATATTIRTMRQAASPAASAFAGEIQETLMATLSAATLAALERARHLPDLSRGRRASSYELAHRAAGTFRASGQVLQSVEDFCVALNATERKIRRSFNSFFGIGPAKLAKFHRLNRVRRKLIEGAADNKVLDVLSACDITEFGRFAGEYKAIFGENPSDTLKRHFIVDSSIAASRTATRRSRN
jgi:AraC family transcriptional regulator, ethanolamine operon transcriptional activator